MPAEGAAPSAVTFDYWNTLCCEPPGGYLRARRLEAMSQVLVDAGVGSAGVVLPHLERGLAEDTLVRAGYDAAWLGWNEAWRENRQFTGVDAAHHICDAIEHAYADADFDAAASVRPLILEAFAGQGEGAELVFLDGVANALAALKDVPTVLGTFSFDANRNPVHPPVVQIVQDGKFTLFK